MSFKRLDPPLYHHPYPSPYYASHHHSHSANNSHSLSLKPRQRVIQLPSSRSANGGGNGTSGGQSEIIAKNLAKERRTCKSFNGEIVWPPKVEAALVEALEVLLPTALNSLNSSPHSTKSNLFPDRNKFCANYIKEKTDCERTARQVGSRIQMLRGKWRGTEYFQLVALPRELDGSMPTSHPSINYADDGGGYSDSSRSPSAPAPPKRNTYGNHTPPSHLYPTSPVAPPSNYSSWGNNGYDTPTSPINPLASGDMALSAQAGVPQLLLWTGVEPSPNATHATHANSQHHIIGIAEPYVSHPLTHTKTYQVLVELPAETSKPNYYNTTLTFTSPFKLHPWSVAQVSFDDEFKAEEPVRVALMSTQPGASGGLGSMRANNTNERENWSYVTEVAPMHWAEILRSGRDIRRYTVRQFIYPIKPVSPPIHDQQEVDMERPPIHLTPTHEMVYRFQVSSSPTPLPATTAMNTPWEPVPSAFPLPTFDPGLSGGRMPIFRELDMLPPPQSTNSTSLPPLNGWGVGIRTPTPNTTPRLGERMSLEVGKYEVSSERGGASTTTHAVPNGAYSPSDSSSDSPSTPAYEILHPHPSATAQWGGSSKAHSRIDGSGGGRGEAISSK